MEGPQEGTRDIPNSLKNHISSIKSTINNLQIEYEHFQKAGQNACTTEREVSD